MIKRHPLPYHSDSSVVFNTIRHLPFASWLDSGKPKSHSGRFDIMVAAPVERWLTHNELAKNVSALNTTHLCYSYTGYSRTANSSDASRDVTVSSQTRLTGDPLLIIKKATQQYIANKPELPSDIPFAGGLLGYFSYDLGQIQQGIARTHASKTSTIESETIAKPATNPDCDLPLMVMGLYPWAIITDHQEQCCHWVTLEDDKQAYYCELIESIQQQLSASLTTTSHTTANAAEFATGTLSSNVSAQSYNHSIERIHEYILAGDCYQVNYAQCFSGTYQGDPYIAYQHLRKAMSSPFSAFLDIGEQVGNQTVMSLSPERFIQTQGDQVLTQPIKGTAARDNDPCIDKANAEALAASIKNQAENVMIVDLLRNDLGKHCAPGSISVPQLFELNSFPNVHHLISSVTGTIDNGYNAIDVFSGSFPGGSITGAPKKRAMEIIDELEHKQRSIYCGSIVYINSDGDLDSNITIRTIACDNGTLYCWGGGGIVADSDAADEYQESLTKIGTILKVLEQFSYKDSGKE